MIITEFNRMRSLTLKGQSQLETRSLAFSDPLFFQARYCSEKCHEEGWERHKDFCRKRQKERKKKRKEKSKKKEKDGNKKDPGGDRLGEEDECAEID